MTKLTLSLAGVNYDRTRAIFDGRVRISGCETIPIALSPEETFHRAFRYHEFDITELSLSNYMSLTAKGICPYVAIPVFPARQFRHSSIYIRTDRGIERPEDLRGKIVGVPEYQMTAALWVRAFLQYDYGVSPASMRWRNGGLEQPGRKQKVPFTLPVDVELKPIPDSETLSQQLDTGKIDALISALAPSCFGKSAQVRRLFHNYRAFEADYFRRTRTFPIMHVVGIRTELVEAHPWLAVNTYAAYVEAKRLCYRSLEEIGHLSTMLPWAVAELEHTRDLMGQDFWSYGIDANAGVIDTISGYAFEQGLTARRLSAKDLFAASTFELAKI